MDTEPTTADITHLDFHHIPPCENHIQEIAFDDERKPSLITVRMSINETALIAQLCGGFSPAEITKKFGTIIGSNFADSDVWEDLVSMVFNRYWDDGLHGYLRGDDA